MGDLRGDFWRLGVQMTPRLRFCIQAFVPGNIQDLCIRIDLYEEVSEIYLPNWFKAKIKKSANS